jgi:hypothetical protein
VPRGGQVRASRRFLVAFFAGILNEPSFGAAGGGLVVYLLAPRPESVARNDAAPLAAATDEPRKYAVGAHRDRSLLTPHCILTGQSSNRKLGWCRTSEGCHGRRFVALKMAKNGKTTFVARRIHRFVALKMAKTRKTTFVARRIHRFVAPIWAEFDKNGLCARRARRIHGFVARVWAKIGKMPHAMQRIAGFVARPGAQQGEKVLCVQCMQRIHGFCARPGQKWSKSPSGAHTILELCARGRAKIEKLTLLAHTIGGYCAPVGAEMAKNGICCAHHRGIVCAGHGPHSTFSLPPSAFCLPFALSSLNVPFYP